MRPKRLHIVFPNTARRLFALVLTMVLHFIGGWQSAFALESLAVSPAFKTADIAAHCEFTRSPRHIDRRSDLEAFATSSSWQRCQPGSLAVGLSSSAIWVRFIIESTLPRAHTVYLEQPMPWIDQQQIWLSYPDGGELSMSAGKLVPFYQRPVLAMNYFFPVRVRPGQAVSVLMRLNNIGSGSVGLRLHSQSSYEARRDLHNLFVGFLAGGTLLILLYNFFLYTALRDLKYVVYVLYGLSVLMFCGALYGFNYQLLWPDSPKLNFLVSNASSSVALAFVLWFMRLLFDLRHAAPRVNRAVFALTGVLVAGASLQVLDWAPEIASFMNTLASTLTLFVVLGVAVWAYKRRLSGSGYFLGGWVFSLGGFFAIAFFANGLIAFSFVTYYAAGTGFLAEIAMFSFALAGRIEQLHSERENARAASVEAQIQLTKSLSRANAELERSVKARTAELEIARAEAEHLALTDGLTGINNRRALFEQGAQMHAEALRSKATYAAIMLDIDHFKRINDKYGHQIGDETLCAIAAAVKRLGRDADIAGRIGGEEFAILLPGTNANQAQVLANRLRHAFAEIAIPVGDQIVRVTGSLGVAESAPNDAGFESVLERADAALYEAKNRGRDRVVRAASAAG